MPRLAITAPTPGFLNACAELDLYLSSDPLTEESYYRPCRDAITAMWWLESGGGISRLAREHKNFSGLKYRASIASRFRRACRYTDWEKIEDAYFEFETIRDFVSCFFDFIDRPLYAGLEDHANDPQGFVKHLVSRGFCAAMPDVPKGKSVEDEYWDRCKKIIDSGRIPQMITPDF